VTTLASKIKQFLIANIVIGAIGIITSLYSIDHHNELKSAGVTDAACNINQTISCDTVAASQYSEIMGIPLGVFGLAFFVSILLLSLVIFRSEKGRDSNISALITMAWIGGLVSVTLAAISTFSVGALCLTCIFVYVLCAALFVNAVLAIKSEEVSYSLKESTNGLMTAALFTAVILLGYSQLFSGSDPTTHPNYIQKDGSGSGDAPPTLSTKIHNIPVNMSAYSGYGEDFRKGSDQAKVTIVEFADMECPACARVSRTINDIAKKYGSRVNVVFKNYPLDRKCNGGISSDFHKHACDMAILARCAGQKGKFWQYHDTAFANQRDLDKGVPEKWAKVIGLSSAEIKDCLANKGIVDKIKDDIRLGNDVGVTGTPSIYINGRKLLAPPNFFAISMEIEKILAN
jgi:protein-disulfide isomerase